LMIALAGTWRW